MTIGDEVGRVDEGDNESLGGVRTAVVFDIMAFATSWVVWGTAIVWSGLGDWEPLATMRVDTVRSAAAERSLH